MNESLPREPRQVTPYQTFKDGVIKNFVPEIRKVEEDGDEAFATLPKDDFAQESVASVETLMKDSVQNESETPVPTEEETKQEARPAADWESGKDSDETLPGLESMESPDPAPSSPSSSSATSPGWSLPPVPVMPPTSA